MSLWLAAILGISAASAQPYFSAPPPEPLRAYQEAEGEAFIGVIVIENDIDTTITSPDGHDEQVRVEVPGAGDVVFNVRITFNKPCVDVGLPPCEDEWSVADVPAGYVVRPADALISEGSFGKFHVFKFTGM